MSDSAPVLYRVVYSEWVRQRIRALAAETRRRGDAEAFVAALKEFDRRVRLYPQFGEPLYDLKHDKGQIWIGIIRPLSMRYALYDDRRLVIVGASPVLLKKASDE